MKESKYNRYFTFIKPITKNPKVQSYSTLVFSIIAAIIFILFAIKPTVSTIFSLQKSIDEKNNVVKQLNQKAQDLTVAKNNLNQIPQSTLDKLDNVIPDNTDLTGLADDLNNLANEYNASVSAIQFQPTDLVGPSNKINPSPKVAEISFTFNIKATYDTSLSLLKDLTNAQRLITIDSVNMIQQSDGPFVATINAKAYFLKN